MIKKIKSVLIQERTKLIIALGLIGAGILSRTLFHIAPNVEFVTAISLVAGYYLGGIYLFIVPLGVMVGSDMFLGNSSIFVFTWSAYLIGGFIGMILKQTRLNKNIVLAGLGAGIAFSIFFYLYTNFGVWIITPWYDKSFEGLMYSYYMGLPFFRLNIVGNLIIVPVAFAVAEFVKQRAYLSQKNKEQITNQSN